jgi:gentisate 1,2-dioxygenase
LVLKSSELVTPEQAGRRVVYLVNDKRKDVSAAVGWLYTGIQVTRPGESTSAHRHKASALRFIMEGDKGYTVVDGNKIMLEVNDFVITPNSTWHEHGVEEGGQTCIWQDGLDIPLVNALEANDYAVYDGKQPLIAPVNHLPMSFDGNGIVPADLVWDKPYSPLFKYSWKKVYPALLEAAKVNEGNPFDGIIMRYSNPLTGGHVMQTMGLRYNYCVRVNIPKPTNIPVLLCTNAPKAKVIPSSTANVMIGKSAIFSAFRLGLGTNTSTYPKPKMPVYSPSTIYR